MQQLPPMENYMSDEWTSQEKELNKIAERSRGAIAPIWERACGGRNSPLCHSGARLKKAWAQKTPSQRKTSLRSAQVNEL
jgi:hypothetical protein